MLNRKEYVNDSSIIWKLCETQQIKGYISTLSFANLIYVMRKQLQPSQVEDILKKLSMIFEFTELNSSDIFKAVEMKWNGFEDAIQSVTAERIKADYIVTRNIKDYNMSKILAFTPSEIIARMQNIQ